MNQTNLPSTSTTHPPRVIGTPGEPVRQVTQPWWGCVASGGLRVWAAKRAPRPWTLTDVTAVLVRFPRWPKQSEAGRLETKSTWALEPLRSGSCPCLQGLGRLRLLSASDGALSEGQGQRSGQGLLPRVVVEASRGPPDGEQLSRHGTGAPRSLPGVRDVRVPPGGQAASPAHGMLHTESRDNEP